MINALKAELRKIYSVRSTYVIVLIVFLFSVALLSFFVMGYKDAEGAAANTRALSSTLINAMGFGSVVLGFIAILSVGHEYRYNTVLFSLTNNRSRSNIFFAKWLVTVAVSLVIALVMTVLCYIGFYAGQSLAGINTAPQTVYYLDLAWKLTATLVGSVSLAFIITMLLRSLVGAVAVVLLLPSTIESLLYFLLKENVKYLPYTSLTNISTTSGSNAVTATAILGAYIAVFGFLAWLLFVRRDAN